MFDTDTKCWVTMYELNRLRERSEFLREEKVLLEFMDVVNGKFYVVTVNSDKRFSLRVYWLHRYIEWTHDILISESKHRFKINIYLFCIFFRFIYNLCRQKADYLKITSLCKL